MTNHNSETAYYCYSFRIVYKGVLVDWDMPQNECKQFATCFSKIEKLTYHSDEKSGLTVIKGRVRTDFCYPIVKEVDIYTDAFKLVCGELEWHLLNGLLLMMRNRRFGQLGRIEKVGATTFQLEYKSNHDFHMPERCTPQMSGELITEPIRIENAQMSHSIAELGKLYNDSENPCSLAITNALYWLNMANSQGDNNGITLSSLISRFRLLWSAFNSLYDREGKIVEKEKIKNYLLNRSNVKHQLENYINKNKLSLKKFTNYHLLLRRRSLDVKINKEFETYLNGGQSLQSYISNNAEEALMLCIYAVRNMNFHGGDPREAQDLVRECIDVLDYLVRISIEFELKDLSSASPQYKSGFVE